MGGKIAIRPDGTKCVPDCPVIFNIEGDGAAVFEATHGTAPKYADLDVINPGSLLLSGAIMFDYLGWGEVVQAIVRAMERTILQKRVTHDLARLIKGARRVKCSEFAEVLIKNF